ncbi:MAG: UDP-N-acetylglucosamine diphosphorylase/glucosamine-1-phosphate N-acetyltransferase [Chloroflexi bacterium HGW-Chloroflexi-1]|nr:MAG: UDP-N-acetylglucosamine diphosphorylase/glucosamine-1-phosphate N-acetyltransferase [Chloroflexi bacterium HGW-Chloroflexi-1]
MRLTAVILAAGQGTRMKSTTPKVLHPLAGQPLVSYAVDTATRVTGVAPVLVVGHGSERVRAALGDRARYVMQAEQLGTGHAVLQARELLLGQADAVLVTYADMPLLTEQTLRQMVEAHSRSASALTILTVVNEDPHGFGRVVRDAAGRVQAVVEEAVCTPEQRAIRELNAGVYCFDAIWLWENLPRVPLSPKGEYYLTDMVGLAIAQGRPVNAVLCADESELLGINTRVHLAEAEAALRSRINRYWMEAGVTLLNPATTCIDATVTIGQDTTIWPNTYLLGRTVIGSGCRIGPGSMVQDCQIGDDCAVTLSVLEHAVMEDDSNIGPFGHLRKGARLCRGAHMGNFGEMKSSTLGPGSKMGHFSYLGDAQIGANVNIGAGTITCNFDGVHKHATVIEDDVFIGSDSMLVAPVRIGQGARTGAGSVVTHDVPAGAVVYGVPARVKRPTGEQ